jgi:hypothetical protein
MNASGGETRVRNRINYPCGGAPDRGFQSCSRAWPDRAFHKGCRNVEPSSGCRGFGCQPESNRDSALVQRQSTAASPFGTGPLGVAFDGANIRVNSAIYCTVTKLRASDGADLGTPPVCPKPAPDTLSSVPWHLTGPTFGWLAGLTIASQN